jgi:hypothetical protein
VEREHARVDLHAHVLPRAERPAGPREEQPDLVLGQVQAGRELLAVDVEPLRRDEQVDPAVLGGHRHPGLGPERRLVLHPGLVVALDPHLGLGVRVAVLDAHLVQHVAERVHRGASGSSACCMSTTAGSGS